MHAGRYQWPSSRQPSHPSHNSGADDECLVSQKKLIGMGDDGLDIVDGTVRVSQHVLDMCGGVEVRI